MEEMSMSNYNFADIINKSEILFNSQNYQQRKQLENVLQNFFTNPNNLDICLDNLHLSRSFLFVFNQIMGRILQKGKYLNVDDLIEKRSDAMDLQTKTQITEQIFARKKQKYGKMIWTLQNFIQAEDVAPHLKNQCVNVISLCFKCLCQSSDEQQLFTECLYKLFPGLTLDITLNNYYTVQVKTIQLPPNSYIPPNFSYFIKVFISLFQYLQTSVYYKSYFQYRKVIYNFKGNYLSFILQLAIFYFKVLVAQNEWKSENMSIILQLIHMIVSYPFSLNLHEFQNDEEMREGNRGEIYFPPIIKILTNDIQLMQTFKNLYDRNNQQLPYEVVQKDIITLVRIFYRLFSANSYFFDSEIERSRYRKQAVFISTSILSTIFYTEKMFISSVLQLLIRVIQLYSIRDFADYFVPFTVQVFTFSKIIVEKCPIFLDSEGGNLITSVFNIVYQLHTQAQSQVMNIPMEQANLSSEAEVQAIMQLLFDRIQKMNNLSFLEQSDSKKEIETFVDFYSTVYDVFRVNQEHHLKTLLAINFQQINQLSQQFWVYLVCSFMNESSFFQTFKETKVLIIKRLFNAIKDQEQLYVYRFIDILTKKFLDGIINSNEEIWNIFQNISQSTIENYMVFILKKLVNSLYSNQTLFSYAMDVLNVVYSSLKKIGKETMKKYSQILKDLLLNLESTLFGKPDFYKMRRQLYQLISVIWVDQKCYTSANVQTIYEIYQSISLKLSTNPLVYFYDVTGLLIPIQIHSPFKIIAQLILQDISKISLNQNQINRLIQDQATRKAIVKLAKQISSDQYSRIKHKEHSALPLRIQRIFHPFLKKASQYPYGKSLIKVYNQFMSLTNISQALPLPPKQNCSKPFLDTDVNSLISNYFQHIHRVGDLQQLYNYICDNGDYLHSWCQQLINRKSHTSPESIRVIIQSKFWKTIRVQQLCAKSLWILSKYDDRYKVIPQLWMNLPPMDTQQEFLQRFSQYSNRQ